MLWANKNGHAGRGKGVDVVGRWGSNDLGGSEVIAAGFQTCGEKR
jgi:hypothetical protein